MPYQNAAQKPDNINDVKNLIPIDEMLNDKIYKTKSKFQNLEYADFKVLGYYHKIGTCMASKKFYKDANDNLKFKISCKDFDNNVYDSSSPFDSKEYFENIDAQISQINDIVHHDDRQKCAASDIEPICFTDNEFNDLKYFKNIQTLYNATKKIDEKKGVNEKIKAHELLKISKKINIDEHKKIINGKGDKIDNKFCSIKGVKIKFVCGGTETMEIVKDKNNNFKLINDTIYTIDDAARLDGINDIFMHKCRSIIFSEINDKKIISTFCEKNNGEFKLNQKEYDEGFLKNIQNCDGTLITADDIKTTNNKSNQQYSIQKYCMDFDLNLESNKTLTFSASCVSHSELESLESADLFRSDVNINDDSFRLKEHYYSKFSHIVKNARTSITINSPNDIIFYNSNENKLARQ